MAYRSDTQIVEELLPPQLMMTILTRGVHPDEQDDDFHEIQNLLIASGSYTLRGTTRQQREKLVARAGRVYAKLADEYAQTGSLVGKFGLVCFYFFDQMIDEGIFVLPDDHVFRIAMEKLTPHFAQYAEIEKVDTSAQKQAARMLGSLQAQGYYAKVRFKFSQEG